MTLDQVILLGVLVTELLINCAGQASRQQDSQIRVTSDGGTGATVALIRPGGAAGPDVANQTASFRAGLETLLVRDLAYQLGANLNVRADNGLSVEMAIMHRPRGPTRRPPPADS